MPSTNIAAVGALSDLAPVVLIVFVAAVLPYLFAIASGLPSQTAVARWGRGYDNRDPRGSLERLEGWRRRAHFAQLNGHEAFGPFAAAMIFALLSGLARAWLLGLGGAFLLFRVVYGVLYVADRSTGRSVVWWCGVLVVVALFLLSWVNGR